MKRALTFLITALAVIFLAGCPTPQDGAIDLDPLLLKGFEDQENAVFTDDFAALGWGGATVAVEVVEGTGNTQGTKALKVDVSNFKEELNYTDRFGVGWQETNRDITGYAGGTLSFSVLLPSQDNYPDDMTISFKVMLEGGPYPGPQYDLETTQKILESDSPQIITIDLPENLAITNLVRIAVQIIGIDNVPQDPVTFSLYCDNFVLDD